MIVTIHDVHKKCLISQPTGIFTIKNAYCINDCHTNDNVCGPWMMALMMTTKTSRAETSSNFTVQLL